MQINELEQRYGLLVCETVRQALTLEEFGRLEIEELVPYFSLRAARCHDEYTSHLEAALPENAPAASQDAYLNVLRRRWQKAEEIAHSVLIAQMEYEGRAQRRAVGL